MLVYYTLQYFSAEQNSHHQVDVGYAKKKYKWGETPHFIMLLIITILFQEQNNKMKNNI
jgi:hypothetical protein